MQEGVNIMSEQLTRVQQICKALDNLQLNGACSTLGFDEYKELDAQMEKSLAVARRALWALHVKQNTKR